MTEDALKVTIDGRPFRGWKDFSVTRSIDMSSGAFELESTDLDEPWLLGTVNAGAAIQIEIEGELVLDGFVDQVNVSYDAESAGIALAGRDRVADILDCAATVDGPHDYAEVKIEEALGKILTPFDVTLTVDADTGAVFKRIAIQPGETVFELVERLCRYRALLPVSDGVGGLILTQPSDHNTGAKLEYGRNIMRGRGALDQRDLFSLYVVKGQAEAETWTTAEESATPEGRAEDALVTRHRPTVIVGEGSGFDATLAERAAWQKKVNRGRAARAVYTVHGWRDDLGALWRPNVQVDVDDARMKLHQSMLVATVTFERSNRGTLTELELARPEAFELLPEKETASDDVWSGGL